MVDLRWFGGISVAMRELSEDVDLAVRSETHVLITGERGLGKELLARLIHARSARHAVPIIPIDCGAPDATSFDSIEPDGTLFLREVSRLDAPAQARLMRLLDVRRGGDDGSPAHPAIRVIASSSRQFQDEVAAKIFREDLFYRLNMIHILVPSLRERRADIPVLVEDFFAFHAAAAGREVPQIAPAAMTRFVEYFWPGNLRELDTLVERVLDDVPERVIRPEHLPLEMHERVSVSD